MEGLTRVVSSEPLVEANRETVEGKIESRGGQPVFPVGGEPGAQAEGENPS
jgi:hypothetical protein